MAIDRTDLEWEEISTKHIIKNEWIDFRESAYRFPNGSEFAPYYSYSRRDYVVIVATDTDGNYICVRQYRQGIRKVTTEFVAGGLERADGKEYRAGENDAGSEGSLEAAKRELLEESGYTSEKWEHLLTVPSNATIADNYAYVYRARDCVKVAEQSLDDTEFLNVELHTDAEIRNLIETGNFEQSVHVMAYYLAKDNEV